MTVATDTTQKLSQVLFEHKDTHVYAVLDGASIPGLPKRLAKDKPDHVCLYRGDLAPDLVATAPYLVQLTRHSPFLEWILSEGWGQHWGIFAVTSANLLKMRKHFRTFLKVFSPEGKPLYFRYYDPRVLRVYLPTCNAQEMKTVFGPIAFYMAEATNPEQLLRFSPGSGSPKQEEVAIDKIVMREPDEDE